MARYEIITLVDITRSNPNRSEINKLKQGQQANFNSLVQAIGMRSNLDWSSDPKMNTGTLPDPFKGKANHWVWRFTRLIRLDGLRPSTLAKHADIVAQIS